MKKVYKIVLLLLLAVTLLGCAQNSEVGKYTLTSIEINDEVYVEGDEEWKTILGMNVPGENIYIELKDNSQMVYAITTNIKNGVWKKEESLVIMNIDGYEEKAEIVEDMLVLVNSADVKLIFKK